MTICQETMDLDHDSKPRHAVFTKMEAIIKNMQQDDKGITSRNRKTHPLVDRKIFSGSDIIEWLRRRFPESETEEMGVKEALHLANLLCQYGYIYPVDLKTVTIKDDRSTEYRFQTPFYWPFCKQKTADSLEYAIYLQKRSMRNKNKHELEPHEKEAYEKLLKFFCDRKDFIKSQAEEQVKELKKKQRQDKMLGDQQERAFWRIHRPPKSQVNCLEEGPKRNIHPNQMVARKKKNKDWYRQEIAFLKKSMDRPRMKFSKAFECYCTRWTQYHEYDPFIEPSAAQPSNPWITDDPTLWELNKPLVPSPTELRVKKWSFSFYELVSDLTGLSEFEKYLEKEYSQENIRFWNEVEQLKDCPYKQLRNRMDQIYKEFLEKGANCEVNVDSKTMEQVHKNLEEKFGPRSRYAFDPAQEHIYNLMKKDSYARYLRSDHYKQLLTQAKQHPFTKKKFFSWSNKSKQQAQPQQRPTTPSPKVARRRGSNSSDRSRDVSSDVSGGDSPVHMSAPHHSYSTSDLKELGNNQKSALSQSLKGSDNSISISAISPNVRRRSDDPGRGNALANNRRSKLEVPRPYPLTATSDKRKSESVPFKSNSIAPLVEK
ncbi:regulator of G-protein signaling 11-like isoform X2 [Mizuhopecten yessoensis]|uniref:Regulator of G-protein signaling 11 n=1 Tax=Mizuhopecten yessoensis TaxID=6573 RepID=A0A210QM35_MIZYE|nr:regulator of G-protein signaling 11-like isoform X2 [Mizuhopecten yessoensis]OWF49799.1 Regulator of G-protein signaling 11 [Mizuhopecten yessoensis]